jgi:hypothetical protein
MSGAAKRKPFKLVNVVPEQDLHEAFAEALTRILLPPAEWAHYPAGSVPLPPEYAAKLYRMGLKPAWPDFLFVHAGIYGIEMKRVGGVLSKTRMVKTRSGRPRMVEGQSDVFPRLLAAGFTAIEVCSSVEAGLRQLAAWDVPLRRWT